MEQEAGRGLTRYIGRSTHPLQPANVLHRLLFTFWPLARLHVNIWQAAIRRALTNKQAAEAMYCTNYAQIIFQPSTSSVTAIVNLSNHVGILDH